MLTDRSQLPLGRSLRAAVTAVVAAGADRFEVVGLAAGGGRVDLLAEQIRATGARFVAVSDPTAAGRIGSAFPDVTVLSGPSAATRLVDAVESDVVLNGITGAIGLRPTLAALRAGSLPVYPAGILDLLP